MYPLLFTTSHLLGHPSSGFKLSDTPSTLSSTLRYLNLYISFLHTYHRQVTHASLIYSITIIMIAVSQGWQKCPGSIQEFWFKVPGAIHLRFLHQVLTTLSWWWHDLMRQCLFIKINLASCWQLQVEHHDLIKNIASGFISNLSLT